LRHKTAIKSYTIIGVATASSSGRASTVHPAGSWPDGQEQPEKPRWGEDLAAMWRLQIDEIIAVMRVRAALRKGCLHKTAMTAVASQQVSK